ncbi:MAG: SBBP repeat-containing protein, partial [Acidobacteriota bacterium]
STFLGGIGDDQGRAIAVDSSGNAYVTGQSDSIDFPTANPFQGAYGGGTADVFVTKLNAAGNGLVFSTYLGGSTRDRAFDIALDSGGNAYVTGLTNSADYPTANSIFPALSGGFDAFVSKLNASGDALVYSTYLGGSDLDHAWGITVDSSGNAYVAGDTHSANFPTANSFQPAFGGGTEDAFVTKLNASGSALVYSTHFGGSGDEVANTIAVDSSGNAYITGETSSIDLPTVNPFQAAPRGMLDIFVTKLDATGGSLVYSTYLGGNFVEISFGIAVDSEGNAYVAGVTDSPNFPTANPLQPHLGSADAFVTKLNAAGNELVYSTHLGGVGFDQGLGIAVDSSGNAYVAGDTDSVNFPTASPFQPALGGLVNALIAKIMDLTPGLPSPVLPLNSVVNGASFRPAAESNGDIAPGAMVAIFGTDLASSTQVATAVPLPTMLVDTSVTFDNIPAPLFFVSNTQINAQVPFELPPGPVTVRVKRGDASAAQLVTVAPFSPGIFTVNSEGTGPGAVLHADTFQLVNESNPARPGEFLSLFATGLGRLRSAVTSGEITPTPPPETLSLPQANIAGIPATVSFSGLAPGFVGLYQVNLQVPESISPGTHLLQVIINGVPSNTVTIAVE